MQNITGSDDEKLFRHIWYSFTYLLTYVVVKCSDMMSDNVKYVFPPV